MLRAIGAAALAASTCAAGTATAVADTPVVPAIATYASEAFRAGVQSRRHAVARG